MCKDKPNKPCSSDEDETTDLGDMYYRSRRNLMVPLAELDAKMQNSGESHKGFSGFFLELCQSEIALWTYLFGALWTYLWRSQKRFCLFNLAIILPLGLGTTVLLSVFLLVFIVGARIFFPSKKDNNSNLNWRVKSLPTTPYGGRSRKSSKTIKRSKSCSFKNSPYQNSSPITFNQTQEQSLIGPLQIQKSLNYQKEFGESYFWKRSTVPEHKVSGQFTRA